MHGKFGAASLLQGGPGPHNWCSPLAQYVLGIEPKIVLADIPDYEVQQKLLHLQQCTNEEEFGILIDDLDDRFDAGYNKAKVTLTDKEDIIMKVSRYYVISRQLEEMQQMCKGLNSFGLLDSLKDFAASALSEFVDDPKMLKSSLIKEMYQVEYSKVGTEERSRKEDVLYQRYQFLDELDTGMEKTVMLHDIDAPQEQMRSIGLQAVLRFLTGSSYPPVTFNK